MVDAGPRQEIERVPSVTLVGRAFGAFGASGGRSSAIMNLRTGNGELTKTTGCRKVHNECQMMDILSEVCSMRLLIALLLPWLAFFTIGRPIAGLICLILQITLVGWIPAAIWAAYAVSQFQTDRKIELAAREGRWR